MSGTRDVSKAYGQQFIGMRWLLLLAALALPSGFIFASPTGVGHFDFAVYATGDGCGAITITGNSTIDSFDSSHGTYAQTKQLNGGSIGSSGNVSLTGNVTVDGAVFVPNNKIGSCLNGTPGVSLAGKAAATGGYDQLKSPAAFTAPPAITAGSGKLSIKSNTTLQPGNYGDIAVTAGAVLTLNAGTYNLNSLTLTGQSILRVASSGMVVVNLAGNGSNCLSVSGGSIQNASGVPSNLIFTYGGTGSIDISGGPAAHALLYAPKASVKLTGGSDWFGAMVVGTLTDSGNVALHYDRSLTTPPTIVGQIVPPPNGAGWNDTNVTVTFTCSDPIFSIVSCTPPVQVTAEVANQPVTGTVINQVGSTATTTVLVNIDKTPPLISGVALPPPNAAGWSNANVTVSFACSDALSGLASCPTPVIISGEGAGQQISETATDKAGNSATTAVVVNLDKTPPTITASVTPAPNAAGWNNANVTVTFVCSDSLSGVATCPAPVQVTAEGANQVISGTATDKAGNSAATSVTVNIDKTPPGLNVLTRGNGTTVNPGHTTITGSVADSLSGVSSVTCQGTAATVSGNSFTCTVTVVAGTNAILIQAYDVAGNSNQTTLSLTGGVPILLSVVPNSGYPGQQQVAGGSVFLTGHDPDFHALEGGNGTGAADITKRAIAFITDPAFNTFAANGIHKFLYATASISPPGGHVDGTAGLTASGYTLGTDFDRADASTLATAIGQLGTTYNALVVASDFGGILTQAELDILNAHSGDIIAFLNRGGGLYAMAETTPPDGLATSGYFGFLPFIVTASPVQESESGNAVTAFGASLGLTNSDVNGNVSHNVFTSTGGLTVVDSDPGGEILSLAGRGQISVTGLNTIQITGQFTNFTSGVTQVDFGAGITTGTASVSDATHLAVPIVIASNAASGGRTVTVTTGSQVVALPNGFTVLAPPSLTLVNPNTGAQGQQNLTISLTGASTHWVQGVTTANFGAGISVVSLTVQSETSASAVVNISLNASPGSNTVTLTTGPEIVELLNGFTVETANQPPLVSAGSNQTITLPTGALLSGTVSDDGLPSGSTLTATWSVVTAPPTTGIPAWQKLEPSGTLPSVQGATGTVYDPNTNRLILFGGGTNNPSEGVWVLSDANGSSTTSSWAQLNISGSGPGPRYGQSTVYDPGSNHLVVFGGIGPSYPQANNDVWVLTNANGSAGTPVWTQLTPLGTPPLPRFNVGTAYDPATKTLMLFGGDIWDSSGVFYYPTNETWILTNADGTGPISPQWISISPAGNPPVGRDAPAIAYDAASNRLIAFGGLQQYTRAGAPSEKTLNDAWVLTNANGTGGVPAWIQLTSDGASGSPAQRVGSEVAYSGVNNSLTIGLGAGACTANPVACTNFFDVWSLANANGLGGTPVWTQMSPVGGPPSPANHSVYDSATDRLIGFGGPQNETWILTNATQSQPGVPATVTFGSPTFSTPNVGGQVFPVNSTATFSAPGDYVLRLAASDSQLSAHSDVTVTVNAAAVPVITSVTPNSGQQGQQNLSVTITGQYTHFAQGTSQISFGAGITTGAITVASATSLTVQIGIDPAAISGPRTITVTTGSEIVSFSNGFTVNAFQCDPVPPGIVAWWPGQNNAVDIVGGNNGTLGNQVTFAPAEVGNGFSFSGAVYGSPGAFINVPDSNSLDVSTVTLEGWVELNTAPLFQNESCCDTLIAAKGISSGNENYALGIRNYNGTLELAFDYWNPGFTGSTSTRVIPYEGYTRIIASGSNLSFNQLHHVAVTVDGSRVAFYVDGRFVSAEVQPGPLLPNKDVFAIASDYPYFGNRFDGIIDELSVYNRALTGPEIQAIFAAGTVGKCVGPPTLQSAMPSTGLQGQAGLTLQVTGQFTHFVQSTTQVSLGLGITVNSVSITSAANLTAQVTIDPSAPLGPHDVIVTTGSEVATLSAGFNVTEGTLNAPVITSQPPRVRNWVQQSAQGTAPGPRRVFGGMGSNYDSSNDRLILFSGEEVGRGEPCGQELPAEVWVLSNASRQNGSPIWARISTTGTSPAGRFDTAIAYSQASNRFIVQGGGRSYDCDFGFPDTWALTDVDGTGGASIWARLPDFPYHRSEFVTQFDDISGNLITFGGLLSSNVDTNDVWVLRNANGAGATDWSQLAPTGTLPPRREGAAAAFDQANNRLIVVGGESRSDATAFNDVWVLLNANGSGGVPQWVQLTPTGAAPTPRLYGTLTYNPQTNEALYFGGSDGRAGGSYYNDLWLLSNANGLGGAPLWTKVTPLGGPPAPRNGHAAAYSVSTDRLIVFSGEIPGVLPNTSLFTNDLWMLTEPTPGVVEGQTFTYSVSASSSTPDDVLTYSLDTAPTGMTIDATTGVLQWVPASGQGGATYPIAIRVRNGAGLSATQAFQLIVHRLNRSPIVSAGGNFSTILPNTATLQGAAYDDGYPTGQSLSVMWSKVSGPGAVTFSDPTALVNTPSFSAPGTYVLRVTVSDTQLSASDDVTVIANATNQAPVVYGGPDQTITLPANAILSGTVVTDESLAFSAGGSLSFSWTAVSGPGTVTIASAGAPGDPSTGITVVAIFSVPGVYVMRFSASDGTLVGTSDLTVTVNPANGGPVIQSMSPNSGLQGQGGPVAIVGQNTHFVQGTTTVNLGTGITVTNVTIACPTCLTAQISIDPSAPTGPHDVTVTTGSEVATLPGGFTVIAGTPILTSLTPASGQQGQTFTFTVTGNFTHFAQGTTQISLGAGVTVSNVTVTSPDALTAQAAIDPAAAVGTRTLTVTTGTEIVSVSNVFNVLAATPIIYTLTPGSGTQGQANLLVVVTGLATHFAQGTSGVSFGAGITVNSVSVTNATSLTAQITIATNAALGQRTVTVTTGTEVASFTNGFTVQANGPIILSLDPGGAAQGQTATVAIVGQGTNFVQGTTQVTFGAGIAVGGAAANAFGPVTVADATHATAQIAIDSAAVLGARTVTAQTGTEQASFPNGFTVVPPPVITSITPNNGLPGAQNLTVAITGQNTHFTQGASVVSFDQYITVSSVSVTDGTHLSAQINIPLNARPGPRTVLVTTTNATVGTEVAPLNGGFTINAPASLLSVLPNSVTQGQQGVSFTITGQATHFVQGTSQVSLGAGITVTLVTVSSPTALTVTANVDVAASTGPRDATVTTGSETATLAAAITVASAPLTLSSVLPNSGSQGQQNLPVTITGQATHFAQGTTQVSFGAGISVSSVTVSSPTSLTATISIDPSATTGPRTVSATTASETATLANGFTVQPGSSGPISVNPGSAQQAQSIPVTITGAGTHFVQGTTVARFGPGISVGSALAGDFGPVTVTSPTSATAQISIVPNALPGSRSVIVQTGSEVDTGTNAFVILGIPVISAVTPTGGNQGVSGAVTINGTYTHFAQGSTQVSFGTGITVNSVTVASATSLTAAIAIDPAAAPGPRTVSVQTGTETVSLASGFSVFGPITGAPPIPTITSPTEGTVITAVTSVTGTVVSPNLDYWTLEYQAPQSSTFVQFATGTTATVAGTLDPTLMLNGNAVIRLTGVDTSGQAVAVTATVVIARNLKIGNFTVSFNDLSVPVAGLPIQVVRTYDSRRSGSNGDFGFGWTLGLNTVTVSTNIALGDGWAINSSGGLIPNYCVQETTKHVVTVSYTDGTTYQFTPVLSPNGGCQQIQPLEQVSVGFTPVTNTGTTPPNAALALGKSGPFELSQTAPGPVTLLDLDDVTTLDPDQFVAGLPDGRGFQISKQNGLQKETDLNGNTLTITPAGITSSTGKSVTFARDSQNRITTINDPSGHTLHYSYSAAGDLATFSDQLNETSTYSYNVTHGLLTIQDPRGVQPIRNDYDANGRLVSHTDAYGNVINYDHSTATNQEIVTDRLGNVTVNEYDSAGNIVRITDALGGVTTRTYDSSGNVLTETNPLLETRTYTYDANNDRLTETDPLNNTTTYTYNSRNQILTAADPLGHVTTNTYDANGNLLSTKDAAGNTTTYAYDARGLQTSITDAGGGVTANLYDTAGNLTQQTDALGNITTYSYDGNGNRLTQTKTRTISSGQENLLTSYQYDALNRVIQTTFADGSTTQVQYNSIGKQSTTIDQLGRQTQYQYDLMGRLIETDYSDTTTELATYDAEGDRISSTDRGGRATSYTYDPLKRLVTTVYADGAANTKVYDAAAEVTGVTDPLGNQTQYTYDTVGHRTAVKDAAGHTTSTAYDAAGNQSSTTDPNGNTTQFQYDADNRRIQTVYADGTADQVGYDALGRTISKTDQALVTTQFQYDKLGRLVQVTDALTQATKYGYDEQGNRTSQTDANSHTTAFAYDKLGRRISRTLPLAMSESTAYDAAGNVQSKTDFNGKTTTYSYDSSNRLLSKTPDASFGAPAVKFTYTASGQRASMTDASGSTTYTYDLRDRLLSKATPEGTLTYTYDLAGNLTSMRSSNAGGVSVNYQYDADNRLSQVADNRLAAGITAYSYDNAGNLQGYLYPNGVQTSYTYNQLNRLTNETVAKGSVLASYAYTLSPSGNRTAVAELGGRQVAYTYDALYRLTGETISGASVSGVIGYAYDPVGNRLSRTSTVAPVPAASYSYDANDRLTADTYDSDGNTTGSGTDTYTYDFENHLLTENGTAVSIVYDGDGNRISKTAAGVTTAYLVDDRNLTGYAQVVEELSGGAVQRVYTYGLSRISQSQASGVSFYGYDGHGSVRLLTDTTGAVTDRYDYDAFGNTVLQAGSTPNVYLYSGEQNDPNLGFYYLRARYLSPANGRFLTTDPKEGNLNEPFSLHRYFYGWADPVDHHDSSGQQIDLPELALSISISVTLDSLQLSYYKSLLGFAASATICTACLINPGYGLQNTALELVADPNFGSLAQAAYSEGQQLISIGYSELGKAAAQVYLDWGLGAINLTFSATQIKTLNELKVYQYLIQNQLFQQYAEGLLNVSQIKTTVGDAYDTWEELKEAVHLYRELGGISNLLGAVKTYGFSAGEKCNDIWGFASSFIPWENLFPE